MTIYQCGKQSVIYFICDVSVSKSVGQSCLTIWDLKSCMPEKLPKQRPLPVSVSSVAALKYKKTTVDYIAPGVADGMNFFFINDLLLLHIHISMLYIYYCH